MPAVPAVVSRAELTAVIERERNGFVALCPEVDVASQGSTVQEARANLKEALELFFETASENEIMRRVDIVAVRASGGRAGGTLPASGVSCVP